MRWRAGDFRSPNHTAMIVIKIKVGTTKKNGSIHFNNLSFSFNFKADSNPWMWKDGAVLKILVCETFDACKGLVQEPHSSLDQLLF